MKNNKFRTVRTSLKYNTKIVETFTSDIRNTHIHGRSLFGLCTGTSITSCGVNLFYGTKSHFVVK